MNGAKDSDGNCSRPGDFDDYQCTGNIMLDFPKLCTILDWNNIPHVYCKTNEPQGEASSEVEKCPTEILWSEPHLRVGLESDDPLSIKRLKIMGWKVHEKIFRVLNKIIPHLSRLELLYFWRAELTHGMIQTLSNTVSVGCSLRDVYLDSNPLPTNAYHLLLCENSCLTRLFLRFNEIGDEDVRLIGAALSTVKTSNNNLQFLNLSFNKIGDTGAAYLAQGLRLNRALRYLALTNNRIGDSGAAELSKVLGELPLTQEEVVERSQLLQEAEKDEMTRKEAKNGKGGAEKEKLKKGAQKPDAKPPHTEMTRKELKNEKLGTEKENLKKGAQKSDAKSPRTETSRKEGKNEKGGTEKENLRKGSEKTPPTKEGKAITKNKPAPAHPPEDKIPEPVKELEADENKKERVNPLLDPHIQHRNHQLFLPGNTKLMYLGLAGNALTEKSLPLFLASVEQQQAQKEQTSPGLLYLPLERNDFPADSDTYCRIKALLQDKNPFVEPETETAEKESQ